MTIGPMTIGLMTIRIFTAARDAEQELYKQADRLTLAREQYVVKKERCEQLGGSMIMRTQRLQEPGYHEYRMAKCATR